MKRNMDLIRDILIIIEQEQDSDNWIKINVEGISKKEISYHIKLLSESGLIEADDISDSEGIDWQAKSLTWSGHDFLDKVKDDTKWQKVKTILIKGGKVISIELIKSTLDSII